MTSPRPAASTATEAPAAPRRRRPLPREGRVVATRRLTPRLISVTVRGEGLDGFASAAPTAHLKVLFPDAQGRLALPAAGPEGPIWPADGPRPTMRTYTPRRYDPATGTLEIQFVDHGPGPASQWARQAQPGDRLAVAGPGGRFQLDPSTPAWLIAGDESALPAVGTLLDALPPGAPAEVHVEIDDPAAELAWAELTDRPASAATTITWHRRPAEAPFGQALAAVLAAAAPDPDRHVWVAAEAATVRAIRRERLGAGHPAARLTTRGYWRQGEANHPDHDYGED